MIYAVRVIIIIALILSCLHIGYQWTDNNPPGALGINVIPQPRQVVHAKSPACVMDNEWTLFVESTADETTRLAAELISKDLNELWGLNTALLINDKTLASAEKSIILGIPKRDKKVDAIATNKAIALNPNLHPQGYKISITPNWAGPGKILILANASQGLFYAAQTFRQLITKDTSNQIILPTVMIDDWPLLDHRGVQINVPNNAKPDYIHNLIHLLSYYKMNVLSLGAPSLTKEQIVEISKETEKYQIKLVGDISTIKPGNSHHACTKTWCGHLNKHPLGWIDLVLKEQRFISKIPKTTVVMNTLEPNNNLTVDGYYEQIEIFRKEELKQILCPRIITKGDIIPDIPAVYKNIYTASKAGLRHLENNHDIMGLILCNTSDKTTTFFETIIEPIVFTAECGWIPDRTDIIKFSSNLTHSLFGSNGAEAAEITNILSSCNQLIKADNLSGYIFTDPFKSEAHLNTQNFHGSLRKIKLIAEETQKKIIMLQGKSRRSKEILDTWTYASNQWLAFAERFLAAKEISTKYQDHYDKRYIFEYAPIETNYQAIKKEYDELFDNGSKRFDALEKEYEKLTSQRCDASETGTIKLFETSKSIWESKRKNVSESIASGNFFTPDELDIILAKLPKRIITPALKPPSLGIEKVFTWWDSRLNHRVLITVENTIARPAIGKEMFAYPVEIKLNFTELLLETSVTPSATTDIEFNPQSIRVVEYSKEGVPLDEIPYQIDKGEHFDLKYNAATNLTWIIRSPIETTSTRYFYVYFDTTKNQAPRYTMKYPYGGLSTSGTPEKGYWLKNSRFKLELSSPPPKNNTLPSHLINSWIIRDFSTGFFTHLNLTKNRGTGFIKTQNINMENKVSLQIQSDGPLLTKFRALPKEDDGCVFNFYENLPICEVFTDSLIKEFHNSYLIPQSYLTAALKNKTSTFSGAEYLSSSYNKGKILPERQLSTYSNDSFWLAQKIIKGLTIATITPEKSSRHYLKTTPEDSNIYISFGLADTKPLHHFIIYADTTEEDTFELMNQIKNIFTLDNIPVIHRSKTETQ